MLSGIQMGQVPRRLANKRQAGTFSSAAAVASWGFTTTEHFFYTLGFAILARSRIKATP